MSESIRAKSVRLTTAFGKLERDERRVLKHALKDYLNRLGPSEYPVTFTRAMLDALSEFYNNE